MARCHVRRFRKHFTALNDATVTGSDSRRKSHSHRPTAIKGSAYFKHIIDVLLSVYLKDTHLTRAGLWQGHDTKSNYKHTQPRTPTGYAKRKTVYSHRMVDSYSHSHPLSCLNSTVSLCVPHRITVFRSRVSQTLRHTDSPICARHAQGQSPPAPICTPRRVQASCTD